MVVVVVVVLVVLVAARGGAVVVVTAAAAAGWRVHQWGVGRTKRKHLLGVRIRLSKHHPPKTGHLKVPGMKFIRLSN